MLMEGVFVDGSLDFGIQRAAALVGGPEKKMGGRAGGFMVEATINSV